MRLFDSQDSAPKNFFAGTHRTRSPEATVEANRRFMARLGITRLANVTGLDRIGLPVCVAIRPNARALATSQGKGATLAAAKASALMESIESWHGERIAGPVHIESWRTLGADAADPAGLALRADATFDPDRPLEWIEGWDIARDRPILVPFETVSTNFVEWPDRRPIFLKSTNGLASGNHVLEAVVHGLYELIERDALTLWELLPEAERQATRVDTRTIADPHLENVLATLAEHAIAADIHDITSDIGIPTFTCSLIEDPDSVHWRAIPRVAGHGTHLMPEIALARAVHEAVQSRVTMISGSRDDMFPRDYDEASGRAEQRHAINDIRERPGTRPMPPSPAPLATFEADLTYLIERLRRVGLESVIAVDLSAEDVGIPVVKLVVPGLEPVRTGVYRPGARARLRMRALRT